MRALYVEALGTFTSVGLNVPQTMGSLRTVYSRFQEVPIFKRGADPLVAAPTPLPSDLARGDLRLMAMGAWALRECGEGRAHESLPLVLCLSPSLAAHAASIFEGVVRHAAVGVHPASSKILTGGQGTLVSAFFEAEAILASGPAPACYIGAIDSLLDLERLDSLLEDGRIKTADNPDGFIPGEGAVFLRVARRRHPRVLAWVRGLGAAEEAATLRSGQPNAATGLAAALKAAIRDAGVTGDEIACFAHAVSGERYFFQEFSLATQRLRIFRSEPMDTWNPCVSVGEMGVAGAALVVAYGAFVLGVGGLAAQPGPSPRRRTAVLCALSDADRGRGAILLNEVPRG